MTNMFTKKENIEDKKEKARKLLEDYIQGKDFSYYSMEYSVKYTYCLNDRAIEDSINTSTEESNGVFKITRKMQISDVFMEIDDKQEKLKRIFNLGKELQELRKLKSSVDNIKSYIKE